MTVEVASALEGLLAGEDTDGDANITIRDRGPKRFELRGQDGHCFLVQGTYALSCLLQDLGRAREEGQATLRVDPTSLRTPAPERISHAIRDRYWPALTRRMDGSLARTLRDPKFEGPGRLYLSRDDTIAQAYYRQLGFPFETLPPTITPQLVLELNSTPGLLGLAFDASGEPIPYVVPGGRFNEMYGWDSYFIAAGLVQDGMLELAKGMADHLIYQVEYYGAILNANRTYYLTRSQPPFLTSFLRLLTDHVQDRAWLERGLRAAMKEYDTVWMGPNRLRPCGLSRYHCAGVGYPPETLIRHYGAILKPFAQAQGMTVAEYRLAYLARQVAPPELDAYFAHDRAVRESGHDTSYRLEGICKDLCTVDLNSLLYRYEVDIATLLERDFPSGLSGCAPASVWRQRADSRRETMSRLCWQEDGFFDYDWQRRRTTGFVSATNLYPLWAGLATPQQARVMVEHALEALTEPGGVAGSTEGSRGPVNAQRTPRQWDYPYGWAPHQMLLWQGLRDYGYHDLAADLALRWMRMVTQSAVDFNGVLAEKYDLVLGSHEVFAEYGNQGAEFRYVPREGFGWTNASYQVGLATITSAGRAALDAVRCSDDPQA